MNNLLPDNYNFLLQAQHNLAESSLKLTQALCTYCKYLTDKLANVQASLTAQSQEPDPDGTVENTADEGCQSNSGDSKSQELGLSLHEAEVTGVEFVGIPTNPSLCVRGVRIEFAITDNPESAPAVQYAEVYYPLSFNGRTRLRQAVENILQRPLTPVEIENLAWLKLIRGKRCLLSARVGVSHSTGRAPKLLHASVVQRPPAGN